MILTELPGAPNFTAYLRKELGDITIEGPETVPEIKGNQITDLVYKIKKETTKIGVYKLVLWGAPKKDASAQKARIIIVLYEGRIQNLDQCVQCNSEENSGVVIEVGKPLTLPKNAFVSYKRKDSWEFSFP